MPTKVDHYALSLLNNLLSDIEEIRLSDQLRIVRLDKINDARGQSLLGPEAISESSQICERVTQLLQKTELVVEGLHIAEFRSVHGYPTHYRVREVSNHALEWQFVGEGEDPFEANYEHSKCVDAFSRALLAIRLLENPGFASRFPATHHVNTGGLIRIFEADRIMAGRCHQISLIPSSTLRDHPPVSLMDWRIEFGTFSCHQQL